MLRSEEPIVPSLQFHCLGNPKRRYQALRDPVALTVTGLVTCDHRLLGAGPAL